MFGIVTVLSTSDPARDALDNYRGLFRRRPWLAGVFTVMLLSLAGIPLTMGFVGKFYIVAADVGASLWSLVIILVIGSAIGLFYYLRMVAVMCAAVPETVPATGVLPAPSVSLAGGLTLAVLTVLLVWLGIYPAPLIHMIQIMVVQLI